MYHYGGEDNETYYIQTPAIAVADTNDNQVSDHNDH